MVHVYDSLGTLPAVRPSAARTAGCWVDAHRLRELRQGIDAASRELPQQRRRREARAVLGAQLRRAARRRLDCRPRRRSGPARRGTARSRCPAPSPGRSHRWIGDALCQQPAASLTIGSTSRHWISLRRRVDWRPPSSADGRPACRSARGHAPSFSSGCLRAFLSCACRKRKTRGRSSSRASRSSSACSRPRRSAARSSSLMRPETCQHVVRHVQADLVEQLERPHRHAPPLHRPVDRRDRRALAGRRQRLGQVRNQHAIDEEAGRIVHQHRRLADPARQPGRGGEASSSLCGRADHFDQRHLRHRIEKVQADDALAAAASPAPSRRRSANWCCWPARNRAGSAGRASRTPRASRSIFSTHRFDDDVGQFQAGPLGRRRDAVECVPRLERS